MLHAKAQDEPSASAKKNQAKNVDIFSYLAMKTLAVVFVEVSQ